MLNKILEKYLGIKINWEMVCSEGSNFLGIKHNNIQTGIKEIQLNKFEIWQNGKFVEYIDRFAKPIK